MVALDAANAFRPTDRLQECQALFLGSEFTLDCYQALSDSCVLGHDSLCARLRICVKGIITLISYTHKRTRSIHRSGVLISNGSVSPCSFARSDASLYVAPIPMTLDSSWDKAIQLFGGADDNTLARSSWLMTYPLHDRRISADVALA